MRRDLQCGCFGAVALEAIVLAMTRRAGADAAPRDGRVQVGSAGRLRGPAGRVECLCRIAREKLRVGARADAGALVAAGAERLLAMARGAIGLAALRFDRVDEQVVGL